MLKEKEPLRTSTTFELWGARYEVPDIELADSGEARKDLREKIARLEPRPLALEGKDRTSRRNVHRAERRSVSAGALQEVV